MYTIENKCRELPEYEYHDGVHTIFLSTKGRNRDEVLPVERIKQIAAENGIALKYVADRYRKYLAKY